MVAEQKTSHQEMQHYIVIFVIAIDFEAQNIWIFI